MYVYPPPHSLIVLEGWSLVRKYAAVSVVTVHDAGEREWGIYGLFTS